MNMVAKFLVGELGPNQAAANRKTNVAIPMTAPETASSRQTEVGIGRSAIGFDCRAGENAKKAITTLVATAIPAAMR